MKKIGLTIILLAIIGACLWYFWPNCADVQPERKIPVTEQKSTRDTIPPKTSIPVISIVRSLEALRKQPRIELPNDVTIRLGVAGSESYVYGGQLLYCLATGMEGSLEEDKGRRRLGPIAYEVINPWETEELEHLASACNVLSNCKKKDELLFFTLVQTPKTGEYRIRFLSLSGELLGTATVTANEIDPHPWQPFEYRGELEEYTLLNAPNPGIAVPSPDGIQPIVSPIGLPRLPLGPEVIETGNFIFSIKGNTLSLSFDMEVWCAHPDEKLLCRWWVNGNPVIPSVISPQCLGRINGMCQARKKIVTRLEINGKNLGAKSDDIIGLQLMYTPCGWEYISENRLVSGLRATKGADNFLVSNRIDFKHEKNKDK